jgi:hypothetical protein
MLVLYPAQLQARNPVDDIAVDRVDLIELNHCYDEQGWLVFEQIIFYDWSPHTSHYNVKDWRSLKVVSQLPRWDARTGRFVAIWHDGKVIRTVIALSFRESWTQYDPELIERRYLPRQLRALLRKTPFKLRSNH